MYIVNFYNFHSNTYTCTDNNIGDDAVFLVDALKSNSALKELNLDGTKRISMFTIYVYLYVFIITSSLSLIHFISGNNINSNVLAKIKKELRRNNNPMHIKEKERKAKLKNMSLV